MRKPEPPEQPKSILGLRYDRDCLRWKAKVDPISCGIHQRQGGCSGYECEWRKER